MKNETKTPKTKPAPKSKRPKTTKKPATSLGSNPPKLEASAEGATLDLDRSRKIFSRIVLGLVVFVLTFFFARTAIWEYNYYKEKEGSPRSAAETVTEAPEVDETEVTVEQRAEYTVAADRPRYLSIEKLGIKNARVLPMGVNDSGELDTPGNIFDVGWYTQSARPGYGGVIVIDGHNGGPNIEGVFKHLDQLYAGDLITLERGDGAIFTYKVVENKTVPLSEADDYMVTAFTSPVPGTEALTLISCVGEWSSVQQTYLSRQFTRAVLEK